jgi:hypothetical protein
MFLASSRVTRRFSSEFFIYHLGPPGMTRQDRRSLTFAKCSRFGRFVITRSSKSFDVSPGSRHQTCPSASARFDSQGSPPNLAFGLTKLIIINRGGLALIPVCTSSRVSRRCRSEFLIVADCEVVALQEPEGGARSRWPRSPSHKSQSRSIVRSLRSASAHPAQSRAGAFFQASQRTPAAPLKPHQ